MPSRRRVLDLAAALALVPAGARADALRAILAGRPPREGRVRLDIPGYVENGAVVPVTVAVESPMTPTDRVTAVHVVAGSNPEPLVLTFRPTPMSGRADLSTRVRLGRSQEVWAVAEMADGSAWAARAESRVTFGGCGGG